MDPGYLTVRQKDDMLKLLFLKHPLIYEELYKYSIDNLNPIDLSLKNRYLEHPLDLYNRSTTDDEIEIIFDGKSADSPLALPTCFEHEINDKTLVIQSVAELEAFQAMWKDTPLKYHDSNNNHATNETENTTEELPKEVTEFTLNFFEDSKDVVGNIFSKTKISLEKEKVLIKTDCIVKKTISKDCISTAALHNTISNVELSSENGLSNKVESLAIIQDVQDGGCGDFSQTETDCDNCDSKIMASEILHSNQFNKTVINPTIADLVCTVDLKLAITDLGTVSINPMINETCIEGINLPSKLDNSESDFLSAVKQIVKSKKISTQKINVASDNPVLLPVNSLSSDLMKVISTTSTAVNSRSLIDKHCTKVAPKKLSKKKFKTMSSGVKSPNSSKKSKMPNNCTRCDPLAKLKKVVVSVVQKNDDNTADLKLKNAFVLLKRLSPSFIKRHASQLDSTQPKIKTGGLLNIFKKGPDDRTKKELPSNISGSKGKRKSLDSSKPHSAKELALKLSVLPSVSAKSADKLNSTEPLVPTKFLRKRIIVPRKANTGETKNIKNILKSKPFFTSTQSVPNLLDKILESQTKLNSVFLFETRATSSGSKSFNSNQPLKEPIPCEGTNPVQLPCEETNLAELPSIDGPTCKLATSNKTSSIKKSVSFNKKCQFSDGINLTECNMEMKKEFDLKSNTNLINDSESDQVLGKEHHSIPKRTASNRPNEQLGKDKENSSNLGSNESLQTVLGKEHHLIPKRIAANRPNEEFACEVDQLLDMAYSESVTKKVVKLKTKAVTKQSVKQKKDKTRVKIRWKLLKIEYNNTCKYLEKLPASVIAELVDNHACTADQRESLEYKSLFKDPRLYRYLGEDKNELSGKNNSLFKFLEKLKKQPEFDSTSDPARQDTSASLCTSSFQYSGMENSNSISSFPSRFDIISETLTPDEQIGSPDSPIDMMLESSRDTEIFDQKFWTPTAIADAANITREISGLLKIYCDPPVSKPIVIPNVANHTRVLQDILPPNQLSSVASNQLSSVAYKVASLAAQPKDLPYPLERQDLENPNWAKFKMGKNKKNFVREVWRRPQNFSVSTNLTSENFRLRNLERENQARGIKRILEELLPEAPPTKCSKIINSTFMLDEELARNDQIFSKAVEQLKSRSVCELDKIKRGFIKKCESIMNSLHNSSVGNIKNLRDATDKQLKQDVDSVIDKFNIQVNKRRKACAEEHQEIIKLKTEIESYDVFFESNKISEDHAKELTAVNDMMAKYRNIYCESS